jgi:hypothetical protein
MTEETKWFLVYLPEIADQRLGDSNLPATILGGMINQVWGRNAVQVLKTDLPRLHRVVLYPRGAMQVRAMINASGGTPTTVLSQFLRKAIPTEQLVVHEMTNYGHPYAPCTAVLEGTTLNVQQAHSAVVQIELPADWPVG